MSQDDERTPSILLTGATGYVGGRLLAAFEAQGRAVRCLTRRPRALRHTSDAVQVVRGDVTDPSSLVGAFAGIRVAYYLVHSMGGAGSFSDQDRAAAEAFGTAARDAGVERIVYLGGLGTGDGLSEHLRSRQDTGMTLARFVPTTEFRAGIVIGAGSLSFDSINALVRRLPVMIAPRWVATRTQPIGIDDVVAYLALAADVSRPAGVVEIGGPDVVTYEGLMLECARQQGLRRRIIGVPLLTPHLSSLWLGLVTPVYARVARKMIDGLRNETVVTDDAARRVFPEVTPIGVGEAIARAIAQQDAPVTRWSDAGSSTGVFRTAQGTPLERERVDSRWIEVNATPGQAFAPIQRIGGRNGWYVGNRLWALRGLLDLAVGGVGIRRGRRSPVDLAVGDTLDFWRVDAIEPDRLLRLVAEMKTPGRAVLQWRVEPTDRGALIRQTAFFEPDGILGHLYWLAVAPFHTHIFRGMLRHIADVAEGTRPLTQGGVEVAHDPTNPGRHP